LPSHSHLQTAETIHGLVVESVSIPHQRHDLHEPHDLAGEEQRFSAVNRD
jgi:hypothetical protein